VTRYFLTLAMLVGTCAYVLLHPPANLAAGRGALRVVPATFGDWSGTDLTFENGVVEELRSDDLLVRRYLRGSDVVWLCVVYHQHRRYGAHDPRVCYESQGYLVRRESRARIADGSPRGLEISTFVAERPRGGRLVWYWWNTAGLATSDVAVFRRRMALNGALENRSWGAFVRIETPIVGGDEAAAARRLEDFGASVARSLPASFATAAGARAAP
jgi:EpsI family protein